MDKWILIPITVWLPYSKTSLILLSNSALLGVLRLFHTSYLKRCRCVTAQTSSGKVGSVGGVGMAQWLRVLASHQCVLVRFRSCAICKLSFLVLVLLQGFFTWSPVFLASEKPTLQIPIRPAYRSHMKTNLDWCGFLYKYCSWFAATFLICGFVLIFSHVTQDMERVCITIEGGLILHGDVLVTSILA